MEKEFVPYELALRMKKLGFDEPCLAVFEIIVVGDTKPKFRYNWTGEDKWFNHNKNKSEYKDHDWYWSAPTFSQAFRWFREKHSLLHELISCVENSWLITIVDLNSKSVNGVYMKRINLDDIDENIPNTYEEAELACLEKLIEIIERKLISSK